MDSDKKVRKWEIMAEEPSDEILVIKAEEEFEALRKAFRDAETRGPKEHMDVHAILECGKRLLDEGHFDNL